MRSTRQKRFSNLKNPAQEIYVQNYLNNNYCSYKMQINGTLNISQ